LHRIPAEASKSPNTPICGAKEKNVDNELVAKIRSHPSYNESLHSALIEVIEKEYSPEQLSVMQDDPVSDSLIRGMLASINTSAVVEDNGTATRHERLQQAEELMRKSLDFLNRRARDNYDKRAKLPRAA
jgi:hypothetical protein